MKFIVLEGLDGAGKSTQIRLLGNYLEQSKQPYRYIKFPRTDVPVYGELIARFLRGELGPVQSVNPYLVALIYAGDRAEASRHIREWLNSGFLVIADRYITSNIAYQCAKITAPEEREKLKEWIIRLEYSHYSIPVPDISLFLDVPDEFTARNLTTERKGTDRTYLEGRKDIHEEDLGFQSQVRKMYLEQVRTDHSFIRIDCSDGRTMLPPEKIFNTMLQVLKKQEMVK